MGKRCLPESKAAWLPSLRQNQDDWQIILDSLGKLYIQGADINWAGFDEGYTRHKVSLPNYPFDRQRYWIEGSTVHKETSKQVHAVSTPSNGKVKHYEENNNGRKNGKVKEESAVPWPEATHSALLAADPTQRQKLLQDFLQGQVARVLGMDAPSEPHSTLRHNRDSIPSWRWNSRTRWNPNWGINLSVASFLQGPTISKLVAEALGNLDAPETSNEIPLIIAHDASNESPLSYGQQALWFLHQLLPDEISFNVAGAIRILSDLDIPALEHAFEQLVERHESLRSTFHAVNGEPVQRVHETMDDFFHVEEASNWSDEELQKELLVEAHRPFDLENGPVLRALLFKKTPNTFSCFRWITSSRTSGQ